MKLGFGCSSIGGRYGESQSLRALSCAYEQGIRHFDIARAYGWGEAERILGKFLRDKNREDYTITTKCGLVPQENSFLLRTVKRVGRQVINLIPGSRNLARKVAGQTIQPETSFSVTRLTEDFHTSLRELGIDYVDILLLHGYSSKCSNLDEILELFQQLVQKGKVRRYGVSIESSYPDLVQELQQIKEQYLNQDFVVQMPCYISLVETDEHFSNLYPILYSPFRTLGGLEKIKLELIKAGLKVSDLEILARIFQYYKLTFSPQYLVCSMFNSDHVVQNLEALKFSESLESNPSDFMRILQ